MRLKILLAIAIAWTLALIMLGAYVRLSDAGLGCPDWPGCYGQLTAPDEAHEIAQAQLHFGGEVVPHKGVKEMLHRYAAGTLGLLVLGACIALWRQRRKLGFKSWQVLLPLVLIIFQALLGMWTVTLKLMPAVVTSHLIGGMTLLALLVWIYARIDGRQQTHKSNPAHKSYSRWISIATCVVALQIVVGAWVSTNYAALACNDFPLCQGSLAPPQGLLAALRPDRELGYTAAGELLSVEHLAAIHWLHRLGALLVALVLARTIYALRRNRPRLAAALTLALLGQISLGIANVMLSLPLALAVAHNGGAALLLGILVYALSSNSYKPIPAIATKHVPDMQLASAGVHYD